jgi:hypothetical protein
MRDMPMMEKSKDLCPLPTMYPAINIANHLQCIQLAALGPPDPREPSNVFWADKATKWQVPEGEARSRLCMNCEHYDDSEENIQCIKEGKGGQIKPSGLPVTPKWADIAGMPSAVCTRFNITCSSIRTCDDWEEKVSFYG